MEDPQVPNVILTKYSSKTQICCKLQRSHCFLLPSALVICGFWAKWRLPGSCEKQLIYRVYSSNCGPEPGLHLNCTWNSAIE